MYEWLSFWEPIKGMEKRFLFWATGSVILVLKWVDMCIGGRQVSPSPTFSLQIPFLVCFRRLMGGGIIHCIMKPFACDADPSWMGGRVQPVLPVSAPTLQFEELTSKNPRDHLDLVLFWLQRWKGKGWRDKRFDKECLLSARIPGGKTACPAPPSSVDAYAWSTHTF